MKDAVQTPHHLNGFAEAVKTKGQSTMKRYLVLALAALALAIAAERFRDAGDLRSTCS